MNFRVRRAARGGVCHHHSRGRVGPSGFRGRRAGRKAVKWLRGYANDTTSDLRSEFVELTREYELMRSELRKYAAADKRTTPLTGRPRRGLIGETRPRNQAPTLDKLFPTRSLSWRPR